MKSRVKQQVAGKLVLFMDREKKRCAGWLDRKVNPLPVARKRWLLFVFCGVCALYSASVLLSPFLTVSNSAVIQKEPVVVPRLLHDEKRSRDNALIPAEQYQRIHAFKLYLDSLAKDPGAKKIYYRIITGHPGIRDSLQKVEDYYQLQK